MNKLLVAGFAAAAFYGAPAFATDMPSPQPVYKTSPAPVPIFNWTGFFVGVNGGYGLGQSDWRNSISLASNDRHIKGGLVGATIGYNWQLANNWVLGFEGDYDGAQPHLKGQGLCIDPTFTCGTNVNELATYTARLGYAWDRSLLYMKAGGAWETGQQFVNVTATGAAAFGPSKDDRGGWIVGAGWEYAFAGNWSAKVEYDWLGFGIRTFALPGDPAVYDHYLYVQTFKFGLNYKFGEWGTSPVVAKY